MNMNIFELIEDKAQAKRVADIMSGTTPFPNRGGRLAALAVEAFQSHGVDSMYKLVIKERLLYWGLTEDESVAAVKAALDAGTLVLQDSDQSIRDKLV